MAGLVVQPSDLMVRSPIARTPARLEVLVVLCVVTLSTIVGGVVGWRLSSDGGGAVLGCLVGLLGSMIPSSLATLIVRRRESRSKRSTGP